MKQYIIKRILSAIPLLIIISFVCFVFINLIPSDPAEVALRIRQVPIITEEAVAQVRAELGLDKPYLIRYISWLADCLRGDFGISYVNPSRTVAGELMRCLPATLQLAGVSFVMVLVLSIPIGVLCAVYKDGVFDRIMRAIVFMTTAMPAYWVGLLLIWLVSIKLDLLPTSGSGSFKHLILPSFTVSLSYISTYIRLISGGMLQRIMIGLALAMKPALLVADEPTTAIDAITQAEILKEFQRIKEESHTAMIFISHDLGAVSKIADEIVVMNGGKLVEQGDFEHILRHAKDPYTRMLAETRRSVMERYRLCLDNQEELCLN